MSRDINLIGHNLNLKQNRIENVGNITCSKSIPRFNLCVYALNHSCHMYSLLICSLKEKRFENYCLEMEEYYSMKEVLHLGWI